MSRGFSFAPPTTAASPFGAPKQAQSSNPGPSQFSFASSSNRRAFVPQPTYEGHIEYEIQEGDDIDIDRPVEQDVPTLYLQPGAYRSKDKQKWKESGRTLAFAVSPTGGERAVWTASLSSDNANRPTAAPKNGLTVTDKTMYFTAPHVLSDPLTTFYTETFTLYSSLQRIVATGMTLPRLDGRLNFDDKGVLMGPDGPFGTPSSETVGHMNRLVGLYLSELTALKNSPDISPELSQRYEHVYSTFRLAQVLYLPQDGRGESLVGEELLDWVNEVEPAPDNDLGNSIMRTHPTWRSPAFWPYLHQCILRGFHLPACTFLRRLGDHPHVPIGDLAGLLASHLSHFPRSTNASQFQMDHQFLSAHRNWLKNFRSELDTFLQGKNRGKWLDDGTPEAAEWNSYEKEFRITIELMEGNQTRVIEQCTGWREAIGAWGVLVDLSLRRDDVAGVVKKLVDKMPIDTTVLDERIQYGLCMGDVATVLTSAHALDEWLAAHLGDIFDKLGLIQDDDDRQSFDIGLRDYFLLQYADVLSGNPRYAALWRIVSEYLATAGEEGRRRLREHLTHVSLDFDVKSKPAQPAESRPDAMEVEEEGLEAKLRMFAEVRETCFDFKLADQWPIISKIVADRLMRRGEYGAAAAMCLQAEDGDTLSRIADQIVEHYVTEGSDEFLRLVDTLPPTVLSEAPAVLMEMKPDIEALPTEEHDRNVNAVFASRLAFLSEFRDYLLFRKQDALDRAAGRLVNLLIAGVAPAGFCAVLLAESIPLLEDAAILFASNETFELMRVLQDVEVNASYAPSDYLTDLTRILRNDGSETNGKVADFTVARKKIEEVRLALARNLARAVVVNFDNPF